MLTFFSGTIVALSLVVCGGFSLKMISQNRESILKPFKESKALKIISGIQNFDNELVQKVTMAAAEGGATHIDIACDPELVKLAKSLTNIPICVSSIEPSKFLKAVEAGADMIEIGNYDFLYDEGIIFTPEDILAMTVKTRQLLPDTVLSVTIPHTLPLSEQVSLALLLEKSGADIIQTEGKMSVNTKNIGIQELIEKAAPTLASAFAISRAVSIPVMCASGLTDVTAPMAIAAGAGGVGIGSMVNKLKDVNQMILAVSAVAASMGLKPNGHKAQSDVTIQIMNEIGSKVNV